LFSKKTEKCVIDDMTEIKNDAKKIVVLCNKCLKMMNREDAGDSSTWSPDWAVVTTEIRELYENIQWIMEEKRGRW